MNEILVFIYVNLEESWFDFSIDHEYLWLRPGEELPERSRHMIEDKKMIVTIA
jgi:hypothetical protein